MTQEDKNRLKRIKEDAANLPTMDDSPEKSEYQTRSVNGVSSQNVESVNFDEPTQAMERPAAEDETVFFTETVLNELAAAADTEHDTVAVFHEGEELVDKGDETSSTIAEFLAQDSHVANDTVTIDTKVVEEADKTTGKAPAWARMNPDGKTPCFLGGDVKEENIAESAFIHPSAKVTGENTIVRDEARVRAKTVVDNCTIGERAKTPSNSTFINVHIFPGIDLKKLKGEYTDCVIGQNYDFKTRHRRLWHCRKDNLDIQGIEFPTTIEDIKAWHIKYGRNKFGNFFHKAVPRADGKFSETGQVRSNGGADHTES